MTTSARRPLSRVVLVLSAVIIGLVFIALPLAASEYVVYVMVLAFLFAALTASYDLLLGYTGQLSFAQGAFYGVGAYTSALLTLRTGMPFWVALPVTGVFVFLLAAGVGYPALKLRGAYFAVTTFFFAHFVYLVFLNSVTLTGGPLGLGGIRPPEAIHLPGVGTVSFASLRAYYYLVGVFFFAVILFLHFLVRSRLGRLFVSIREDEVLAESIGVNTAACKVLSFSISAALAGLAGGLFAHFFRLLHPSTFAWMTSEMVVIMTLVGGTGTLFGPVLGAGIVTFILELMRFAPELRFIVWAVALIAVLVFEPRGLAGIAARLFRRPA